MYMEYKTTLQKSDMESCRRVNPVSIYKQSDPPDALPLFLT